MSIKINEENINAFLHFGWLPRPEADPPFPNEWISDKKINNSHSTEEDLIKEGVNILREAIKKSAEKNKKNIVPLSGGLDSRVVLAVLKESKYNITAISVGIPGTFDFDISKLVARKLGVEHISINLNEISFSTEDLVSVAKKTNDWVNITEVYFNFLIPQMFGSSPIITGLLGDFLGGEHAHKKNKTWDDALESFCSKHGRNFPYRLTSSGFDPKKTLPQEPKVKGLNYYEELVFRAYHTCTYRPHLFSTDFDYRTPFKNKEFVQLMISAPPELREKSRLYHKILMRGWPDVFSLPCRNYCGATISSSEQKKLLNKKKVVLKYRIISKSPLLKKILGPNPMSSYLDWDYNIKNNKNVGEVFEENIFDLKKRKIVPWINIDKIWNDYLNNNTSFSKESKILLLLNNLEINIKASEQLNN